jgi:hypothetical protein
LEKPSLYIFVELEDLTVVVMKSTIFWDITLSSAVKVHAHLGSEFCLWLQGLTVFQARNRHEIGTKQSIILQKRELFCTTFNLKDKGFIENYVPITVT